MRCGRLAVSPAPCWAMPWIETCRTDRPLRPVPRKGRQVKVLYETVTRRRHALILALLIAVVLVATACSSPATPSYLPRAEPVAIASATPSAFPPSRVVSKGQRLRFEHISVEDGLSQNAAFAILRDSNESCEPTGVSGLSSAQDIQISQPGFGIDQLSGT